MIGNQKSFRSKPPLQAVKVGMPAFMIAEENLFYFVKRYEIIIFENVGGNAVAGAKSQHQLFGTTLGCTDIFAFFRNIAVLFKCRNVFFRITDI